MADSRTERLCVLLSASRNRHCLILTYFIKLSLMSADFPKKYPRIIERRIEPPKASTGYPNSPSASVVTIVRNYSHT